MIVAVSFTEHIIQGGELSDSTSLVQYDSCTLIQAPCSLPQADLGKCAR
jgi:hypothetical protein